MHVGIDTVALGGEGFQVHVRKGDRVRAGDLLLTFDLDRVARTRAEPHDAGDHHQRRALPDPQREPQSRRSGSGDVLFELEEVAPGAGGDAGDAARRWSAKRWWSRMRTASTRGPRR